MENDKYHTPASTPTITQRRAQQRSRRREGDATPMTASPIVINLELCENELKKEVARQDSTIREQDSLIKDLRAQMEGSLNDSVFVDVSNQIADQEKRLHDRDFALVDAELKRTREELRNARTALTAVEQQKKTSDHNCDRLRRDLEDRDEQIKSLNNTINRLEQRILAVQDEETHTRIRAENANESLLEERRRALAAEDAMRDAAALAVRAEAEKERVEETLREARDRLRRMEIAAGPCTPTRPLAITSPYTASVELESSTPLVTMPVTPSPVSGGGQQIVRRLSAVISLVQPPHDMNSLAEANQRIGSLSMQSMYQGRENAQLKDAIEHLKAEIQEREAEEARARSDYNNLQVQLTRSEWNADQSHKYLTDELVKIKEEKASLRVQLMQSKREAAVEKARADRAESQQSNENEERALEVENLRKEKAREESTTLELMEKLREAEKKAAELDDKTSELQEARERIADLVTTKSALEDKYASVTRTATKLKEAIEMLDDQAEAALRLKERADERRKKAEEEVEHLRLQLQEEKTAGSTQSGDYAEVAAERDRLKSKVTYYQEELTAVHSDYREELASLARQINEKKRAENKDSEAIAQLAELRSDKSRLDNDLRNEARKNEQLKEEVRQLETQMQALRESERRLQEETGKLRTGLAESLNKIEAYKNDSEASREITQGMAEQLGKAHEKAEKQADEICELEEEMKEKERLVSYLQSQINAKAMPKVSRKSTLLRAPSMMSAMTGDMTIVDESEVLELENRRTELYAQLEKKKHELSGRKEEATPKKAAPVTRIPLTPIANGKTVGVMRHNIPHRWKDQLGFGVRQLKCAACFEGVPRVRYAKRCAECSVVVHSQCVPRVENTCGLPDQCASFYVDAHVAPSGGGMNGWVRIYRDDAATRVWRSAWGRLASGRLDFYDDECLANEKGAPMLSLDLKERAWTLAAAADAPHPEKEGANCINIQVGGLNVYMLAPTPASRARWAQALQSARGSRLESMRRPSSSYTTSSLLFALDAPANLTINAVFALDDWLLIGCQEGLFVSSISNPRAPFSVSGITSIYALEGASDIGVLLAIVGAQRELALLSFSQLKAELAGRQPAARPQLLSQWDHVHLLMYNKVGNERYVVTCNSTDIVILRYHERKDCFMPHHVLPTAEPATCLTPWPTGFFFGGDSFYSVSLSGPSSPPLVKAIAPSHIADYPIAVLPISDREILLAYQNYGRFVAPDGTPTRSINAEWDTTPLEFCYTAPYLYVISMTTVEILQVADYAGPSSAAFQDERELVRTTGAHIVGRSGSGDVQLALSSSTRTELHSFNAGQKRTSSVLKRKGSFGVLDKRSKTSTSLLSN